MLERSIHPTLSLTQSPQLIAPFLPRFSSRSNLPSGSSSLPRESPPRTPTSSRDQVRLNEERSDLMTTQSLATKTARARTFSPIILTPFAIRFAHRSRLVTGENGLKEGERNRFLTFTIGDGVRRNIVKATSRHKIIILIHPPPPPLPPYLSTS